MIAARKGEVLLCLYGSRILTYDWDQTKQVSSDSTGSFRGNRCTLRFPTCDLLHETVQFIIRCTAFLVMGQLFMLCCGMEKASLWIGCFKTKLTVIHSSNLELASCFCPINMECQCLGLFNVDPILRRCLVKLVLPGTYLSSKTQPSLQLQPLQIPPLQHCGNRNGRQY
ncbi:unnamed protein product, partial [Wuchereria bancrofti]